MVARACGAEVKLCCESPKVSRRASGARAANIRGAGNLWIAEGTLTHDGAATMHFVKIVEFRAGRVQRETLYFGEPFDAPEWREPWRAEGPLSSSADLPVRIRGGS
jgi:hypothetical protein